MSYGLKYKLGFTDFHGKNLQVNISELDYGGDVNTYLGFGASHAIVKFQDVPLWQPVKPSNAEIKLVAESAGKYDEFKNAKDRQYKISILETGVDKTVITGQFDITGLSSIAKTYPYNNLQGALDGAFYWLQSRIKFNYNDFDLIGYGFCFGNNGNKLYVVKDADNSSTYSKNYINQYNLSEAYNPASGSTDSNGNIIADKTFVPSRDDAVNLVMNNAGDKLYYVHTYDKDAHQGGITECSLSTSYEIDSASETNFLGYDYGVYQIEIKPDATKLFWGTDDNIKQADMTGGDITTLTNEQSVSKDNFGSAFSLSINDSGNKMYLGGYDYTNEIGVIERYSLSTSYDITSYSIENTHRILNAPIGSLTWNSKGSRFFAMQRIDSNIGLTWGDIEDTRWRSIAGGITYNFKIDENGDGTSTTVSSYTSSRKEISFGSHEAMINYFLNDLKENDSNYTAEDTTDNGLLDKIIRTTKDYSYTRATEIEAAGTTYSTGYITNGQAGDELILQTDENGTVTNLANYIYEEGTTIESVIQSCIEQINNNFTDYNAEQNETDESVIDITYTGSLGASEVTLQVDTGTEWGATASGLNSQTINGDTLLWTGFNVGGLYKEEYVEPLYELKLTAYDGLGDLDAEEFPFETGGYKLIYAIARMLKLTGSQLPINSGFDIYEDNMNQTASDDPLAQIYIDRESIVKKGGKEILNQKLKGFKLQQSKGEWWISPVDINSSFDYRTFDYNGNYLSNSSYNPVINFGTVADYNNNEGVNIERSGLLEVEPGARYYTCRQTYGLKEQLLKDPTLAFLGTDGNLKYWSSLQDNDSSYEIYTHNSENVLKLNSAIRTGSSELAYYIEQTNSLKSPNLTLSIDLKILAYPYSDISLLDNNTLLFEGVTIDNDGTVRDYIDLSEVSDNKGLEKNIAVYLEGSSLDTSYWLYIEEIDSEDRAFLNDTKVSDNESVPVQKDIEVCEAKMEMLLQLGNNQFYDGEEFVSANQGIQRFEVFSQYVKIDKDETKNQSFDISITSRYETTLRILQPYYTSVLVNKVTLKQDDSISKGNRKRKYYSELTDKYKKKSEEIKLYQGDIPESYVDSPALFINALYLDKAMSNPTQNWNSSQKYFDIITDRIVKQKGINGEILTGQFIHSNFSDYLYVVYDKNYDKYFAMKGMSHDITMGILDGEWVEIAKGSPGTLITEDRLYEDDPAGVQLYSENRDDFGGEGGVTRVGGDVEVEKADIVKFNFLARDLGLVDIGSFKGQNTTSEYKINIKHNRQRAIAVIVLSQDGEELGKSDYKAKFIDKKTIEFTINTIYDDSTQFDYLIY